MFKAITIALLAFAGQSAFAQSGIGPAGCGLGNMVMGKDNQVFAATTNGTFASQLFGITSGTSNCERGGSVAQMTMFVESNRVALSNEAARGQGETVTALSSILGCQDADQLGADLKSNYSEIFANKENSVAISRSIQNTIQKNPALAQTCQPLS
jgi:Protein of unknown function (DUF3015)